MGAWVVVGLVLGTFLLLVGVVSWRQRRRATGLTDAEAAHAWHREQRLVGDDYQEITDHGR